MYVPKKLHAMMHIQTHTYKHKLFIYIICVYKAKHILEQCLLMPFTCNAYCYVSVIVVLPCGSQF